MRDAVLEAGVHPEAVHLIPIGINLDFFPYCSGEMKRAARERLGIPLSAAVVGSFQKDGVVTAGNASQIVDGAAAVMLMSAEKAEKLGLEPLGTIEGHTFAGLPPKRMGLGPSYATSLLLDRTGVGMADIGLIEMNEAFAAVVIANEMVFADDGLSEHFLGRKAVGAIDRGLLNVNGGAVAVGHPVGSSGTRILLTLLLEMRRRSVDVGLATLCVGGGQGASVLLRRP